MNKIEIKNVTKTFGSTIALKKVNLTFEENKIYGLLGRNGAGKSTLLNITTNRMFADEGQILMNGEPFSKNDHLSRQIYMMSEQTLYPDGMKVMDAFKWSQQFYPAFDTNYARKLSQLFNLNTKKNIKSLSTGNRSIFKIVIALSVNVSFLFLDEPILGLDANHRELFYKILIEKYAAQPFTAVISTHLIEEAAGMIEEVIIIKDGEVLLTECIEDLIEKGYSISGKSAEVDSFIADKHVIGIDSLGSLKTAYILGQLDRTALTGSLDVGSMDLQKIFIQLTNS